MALDAYDKELLLSRATERTPEGRYLRFEMLMCDFGQWSRTGCGMPSYRHAGMQASGNPAGRRDLTDEQAYFIDSLITRVRKKVSQQCSLAFNLLYLTSSSDVSSIKRLNKLLDSLLSGVPKRDLQAAKGACGKEFVDNVRLELLHELDANRVNNV